MPKHRRPFRRRLMRGLDTSIRGNSRAYGYSIVVTADFAVLSRAVSPPGLAEIYLFIFGAVLAFALVEAVGSRMFTKNLPEEPSRVVALGSAIGIGLTILFAAGIFVRRGMVGWVFNIILIGIGLTSCCFWPATIPLIIFWIKGKDYIVNQ